MFTSHSIKSIVRRVAQTHAQIINPYNVPVTLFANSEVVIEAAGIWQLFEFLSIQTMLKKLWEWQQSQTIKPFWGDSPGVLEAVVLTPDFHKGSGIPVGTVAQTRGFVIPAAVGNDICCGMRLLLTDLTRDQLQPHLDVLERRLRAIYFEGERNIPMSPRQREALLRDGLPGLYETREDNGSTGLWQFYDSSQQRQDLAKVHFQGCLKAENVFAFADYIRASGSSSGRDSEIGSIGGGNHFVEIQTIKEIFDGATAHLWGVKPDSVAIMVHTGSVGLGHVVGRHFNELARSLYPSGQPHPSHDFYVLPFRGPHRAHAQNYLDAMNNAANFAFGNRLFLGLMAVKALTEAVGRQISTQLVYDAPHNLIWKTEGSSDQFLHRKGACPALGANPLIGGPFQYTGHPVIIPGSMGASSFLLAGQGNIAALESACHGAGRSLTRGEAIKVDEDKYAQAIKQLRVVTPIDAKAFSVRSRKDILANYHQRLKEEAPYAYKPISPIVETVEEAAVAKRVARLWPLVTVKG